MLKSKCNHIIGIGELKEGSRLIEQELRRIDLFKTFDVKFKYCPKCGESLVEKKEQTNE